jgi:hypothetical protein
MAFEPGDVVIRRPRGVSICFIAAVLHEGVLPAAGRLMDLVTARLYAVRLVAATHGQVYELDEDGHPYSH